MAEILNSQNICGCLEKEIKLKLGSFPKLCLASVVIGDDFSAKKYRSSQERLAANLGVGCLPIDFEPDIAFDKFVDEVSKLNEDKNINGIIFNKPFPPTWRDEDVFSLLDENKDVEGMHPISLGKFFMGKPLAASCCEGYFVSPTVLSIRKLLDESLKIKEGYTDYRGKKTTIVGFSSLIGRSLTLWLGDELATVSIANIETYYKGDLPYYINNADILISAAGKPHLIRGDWIKEGAIVIDVGTAEKDGKLTGDVEFETAKKIAAVITPVPGGVGKLTTVFLFHNLIIAARKQKSL